MKNVIMGILSVAGAIYLQVQNCVVASDSYALGGEPIVQISGGILVTGLVLLGKRLLSQRTL